METREKAEFLGSREAMSGCVERGGEGRGGGSNDGMGKEGREAIRANKEEGEKQEERRQEKREREQKKREDSLTMGSAPDSEALCGKKGIRKGRSTDGTG